MMKICLLGNSDSIHLQNWSRWFVNRGYDVHLITTGTTKIQGVTLHRLKKTKSPINYFLRIIKTIQIIRRLDPHVINAHYISGTETFAAALSHYHPFIVSAWGSDIARDPNKSWVLKTEVKYILRQADIVHIGDEHGKQRLAKLGCEEHKIFILPWGVEIDKFRSSVISLEKKTKYVVLSVNPWFPNRNIDILLRAIPTVIKKIKDIKFLFIGGGSLEQELKTLAKQLAIQKYIEFVGKISHEEIPKYFSISDLLIDTSIIKDDAGSGIGVANMEAMAYGIPLLLGERGYLKKAGKSLKDESWYCSIVYDAEKPEDLGEKILILLNNEFLRRKISEQEMKIAHEIGDWNKNMEKMEQIMLGGR